jgi:Ethanolamine utilization protein EutJ (predicted chaperonin)
VYAKRMDNLAPEPGCGTDNVQFATIDWESCSPVELAKHLFDTVPDGLAEEFRLKAMMVDIMLDKKDHVTNKLWRSLSKASNCTCPSLMVK